jgi:energy-converting hydrogenase Eha subunit B
VYLSFGARFVDQRVRCTGHSCLHGHNVICPVQRTLFAPNLRYTLSAGRKSYVATLFVMLRQISCAVAGTFCTISLFILHLLTDVDVCEEGKMIGCLVYDTGLGNDLAPM